jgi:bla regulator protein blaR1
MTTPVSTAAWSFSNLKRRIMMVSHPSSSSFGGRVLAAGAVALVVVAIAPVKAVARSASSVEAFRIGSQLDFAVTTPASTIPASEQGAREATAQDRSQQEELHFVYFSGENNTTMNGSSRDMTRARRYVQRGERMLWFERNGREYIVRDANVLRDVEELWEPLGLIGAEQGKIGAKQGAIGAEQGRYGAKQGKIGAEQGFVGAKQGVVAARLGLLAARESQGVSASERREIDRERAELERDMRSLEREMEALGRQMRDQSPPMRDLGDEMSALGSQMAEFGRQMESASRKANAGMRSLMDRAIRSGAAQEVR